MKAFKETFAGFLEEPSRDKLRLLIQDNFGELNEFEFKSQLDEFSKLAKHMLAMANASGGIILLGVEENENKEIVPSGLTKFIDKSDIFNKTKKYLPSQLKYIVLDFSYTETEYATIKGKKFQTIIIEKQDEFIPFLSLNEGINIRKNSIYTRVGTKTEEADYYQLQEILNKRISTGTINSAELKLSAHIQQLKELYNQIDKYKYSGDLFNLKEIHEALFTQKKINKHYPKEDFDKFMSKLIEDKKKYIERLIK